ncbi:MAG TPA: ABC transporter substrate-binding protein, partial [Burkholderiaceae bacterium]|nr:ABC transporter substrate-binding protein [Burkholderiaceae bacterium]
PVTPAKKVLRYAFEVAETSLDPVKLNDLYSRILTAHLFEALYTYDHLARPVKIKPLTAAAMPDVSADFRVWTIKLQPGIFFADDPVWKGGRRELVAQDYVYAIKRFADPANKAPAWTEMETLGFVGLAELRDAALKGKTKFDYDRAIEGLRALDRHTLQIRLAEPRPRLVEALASSDLLGAVAREVVEFYGDQFELHPIGTGPFKLVQWRRSSFIAFERNPDYRERFYDAEPAADDAEGQAVLAKMKGKRLPLVDRVEVAIIEEEQPRWLSFVGGEADLAYRVGYQFASQAMPGGKVAPNLAKQGIAGYRIVEPAGNYYLFNMEDALVGGYTPERVALRRAISLGMDSRNVADYAYDGLATVAQGPILPYCTYFDARFKSECGDYDPGRARALLDLYGYVDKNGDGLRETPDGQPVVLTIATQADQRSRRIAEVMSKNMKALGIGMRSQVAQWPENLKAGRAGKLQMWYVGGYASSPDPADSFARMDSRQIGGQNMSRVKLPALDALYDRMQRLPDGPERGAVFAEATRLALAYLPYKFSVQRLSLDMTWPQVVGYRRPVFWLEWWHQVDIDDTLRQKA